MKYFYFKIENKNIKTDITNLVDFENTKKLIFVVQTIITLFNLVYNMQHCSSGQNRRKTTNKS